MLRIILFLMLVFAQVAGAVTYHTYSANSLTGGVDGALDKKDGLALINGDIAIVVTSTEAFHYMLNASSGAAESSPDVIMPDTNAGLKRWILKARSTIEGTIVKSTGEGGGTKFLREDGDGTSSWQTLPAAGDVVGPGSATDNAVARYDLTTGKLLQDSEVEIDDLGRIYETFDLPLPTFNWEAVNGSTAIQTITDQNAYHVQYGFNYFAPVIDPASSSGTVNIYQVIKVEPTRPNTNSLSLTNSTIHGVYVYARDNGSGGEMASVRGATIQGGTDDGADVGSAIGVFGIGIRQGTGDADDVKGVWAQGTAGTTGVGQSITNVYAVDAEVATSNTGAGKDVTIDNAYGVHSEITNNNYTSGSSTITDAYGAYLKDASGTGTITNFYQLYIEDPTEGATLNYSIYSEGGLNYFGGDINSAGAIEGKITVAEDTDATVDLVSASECSGQAYFNADADAIAYTLPPAEAGLNCCFANAENAGAITVDPDDGVDRIILEGVDAGAGAAVASTGAVNDMICILARDATYWVTFGVLGTWGVP